MWAKTNPTMETPCVSVHTVLVLLGPQDTDRFQGDSVVERGHGILDGECGGRGERRTEAQRTPHLLPP
ncbi:hypothetical protein [Streptomyces sp. NPDC058664]|uniref:hypothetical protein n=1 Tax=unclassified Streptomyces TaxID=2593676 RepID=UPI003654F48D